MIEFVAVCLGITLGEGVREWRARRPCLADSRDRSPVHIIDPKRPCGSEQLDPLIIAVSGPATVADQAYFAAGALQHELRRIDISQRPDFGIDQAGTGGI